MNNKVIIENLDKIVGEQEQPFIIPQLACDFRACVSGPSHSGKTNMALNLILNYIYWDKIYIFSTSCNQSKYKWLKEHFEKIHKKMVEEIKKKHKAKNGVRNIDGMVKYNDDDKEMLKALEPFYFFEDDMDKIPSVNSCDSDKSIKKLFIFDDCIMSDKSVQNKICQHYIRGRHLGISYLYLSQKWCALDPKIRENSTMFFFLGPQTRTQLNTISATVPLPIDYAGWKYIFKEFINTSHDFVFCNVAAQNPEHKLMINLNDSIDIKELNDKFI